MKKRTFGKTLAMSAALGLALVLVLTGCPVGNDPSNDIAWVAVARGTPETIAIDFVFGMPVTGLTASDITVAGETGIITAGALTGSGVIWTLTVTHVARAGNVAVSIARSGIVGEPQAVAVSGGGVAMPGHVAWIATARGTPQTTAIDFVFTESVTGLTSGNIVVAEGTGAVMTGALTGGGTSWSLAVTVARDGDVEVLIDMPGIETGPARVTVHALRFSPVRATSAGTSHTLAIREDGTLWAWGSNTFGRLGDGTTTDRDLPVEIQPGTTWLVVSAGDSAIAGGHTMGIRSDGSLWAWGRNGNGQLGDGTGGGGLFDSSADRHAPVQIQPGTTWSSVSAGVDHTVAIRSDGSLWTWGGNLFGQLGDGTITNSNVPIRIGSDYNWAYVSAGNSYSAAIRANGSLWVWGSNASGRLGDGTTAQRRSPVQIQSDMAWVSVSAGDAHTAAIGADGSLWVWGNNSRGQVGNGSTWNRFTPFQIHPGTTWISASVGIFHTVAVRSDGTLWAWGNHWIGLFGGSETHTPTQIQQPDAVWASVSAGGFHSMAIREDGMLWAWGSNTNGQIGDGTTIGRNSLVWVLMP